VRRRAKHSSFNLIGTMKLAVEFVSAEGSVVVLPLGSRVMRVGSSAESELRLNLPAVTPHAASLVNADGQVTVYPANGVVRSGGAAIDSSGVRWKLGEAIAIDACELTLVESRAEAAAPVAVHRRTQKVVESDSATPRDLPKLKAGSDMGQYLLIGLLIVGAVGVVLIPEPSADSPAKEGPKVTVSDVLAELEKVDPKTDEKQPSLRRVREQILAAFRSAQSPPEARRHYATAMSLLLARALPLVTSAGEPTARSTGNAHADSSAPGEDAYEAPVQFATELEFKLYNFLRIKLAQGAPPAQ
jgi:hypothetical protein